MTEEQILSRALEIVQGRMAASGLPVIDNLEDAKNLIKLRLGGKEQEHFLVVYMTGNFEYITDIITFIGADDRTVASPRVIARKALELNAKAVLVAHNHPSGDPTPGEDDAAFTKDLVGALDLIDAILVDHMVVGEDILSMAEEELLG